MFCSFYLHHYHTATLYFMFLKFPSLLSTPRVHQKLSLARSSTTIPQFFFLGEISEVNIMFIKLKLLKIGDQIQYFSQQKWI